MTRDVTVQDKPQYDSNEPHKQTEHDLAPPRAGNAANEAKAKEQLEVASAGIEGRRAEVNPVTSGLVADRQTSEDPRGAGDSGVGITVGEAQVKARHDDPASTEERERLEHEQLAQAGQHDPARTVNQGDITTAKLGLHDQRVKP